LKGALREMLELLFKKGLAEVDPDVSRLAELEAERQVRKIIMIPSESVSPLSVRQALGTAFHNIYAEGYPPEDWRWMDETDLLDYDLRLASFRRYADPRYYKGVEYADILESLARRRCAETFAANGVTADDLYVNVQALSGSPANNAVFHALLEPGDAVMSMDLLHGGHLSHGSPVNRSGKYFDIIPYTIRPETEQIDYDDIRALALEHRPRMIIGGFSSYPWQMDWAAMRRIADEVGAYLLADIAHVAGLVAGGVYPSPVGIADVVTTTTHKSLCGPRGAVILTEDHDLAMEIDRAVFPGEQGGPHVNVFGAMAITFKLAKSESFRQMQKQIVTNCAVITNRLRERGFGIAYGGTNTHLMNLDAKTIKGPDGTPLSGDQASRILDMAGIVTNRNTIPGDRIAGEASGVRMGTPWVTQYGFGEQEMAALADIIADLLNTTQAVKYTFTDTNNIRGKVDFKAMEDARMRVRDLLSSLGPDFPAEGESYPHFYFIDDQFTSKNGRVAFDLSGERVRPCLNLALTSNIEALQSGERQSTRLNTSEGSIKGVLECLSESEYRLSVPENHAALTAAWLRAVSDGYIKIDDDVLLKPIGPVRVRETHGDPAPAMDGNPIAHEKPWYIGIDGLPKTKTGDALPEFTWEDAESNKHKRTPLYEEHKTLKGRMIPFAGWEMPVWYSSVTEEHMAVREAAGLFDVAHMGVFQAEGVDAAAFLNSVCPNDICGNDANRLEVGRSLYTQLLDPHGNVIDDLLIYRRDVHKYLMVVNACNEDKDWAWLNAIREGKVMVDPRRPWVKIFGRGVKLRNLKDPAEGADRLVDIALQGPKAREVLLALGCDAATRRQIRKLQRTELCEAAVGGFDLVISRTGYTGEEICFELFVHPDQAAAFWRTLLETGNPFGVKPCGLAARDSLRTEFGLPLYGQEMAGELNLSVGDAGFHSYIKTYKPWFIGRNAYLETHKTQKSDIVRFRFEDKGVRMAHYKDPVVDRRGKMIGVVTSCAVDSQGTLTGLAWIDSKQTHPGTTIFIFQGAPDQQVKAPASLETGDRTHLAVKAVILPRFMSQEQSSE
jgi:glycine hydroxymethyltransferase